MRALLLAAALLALGACASPAKRVAGSQNAYDFLESVYEETCLIETPPAECGAAQADLKTFEKHLHGAAKALANGGALPLQLAAIKADEKKVAALKVMK